jgi:Putative prokaryotic signal transducing protein
MSNELVTVVTSYDIVEAEFLRNHLEEEGFEVYLADENIVGAYNLLANAVGGIKIKVPSDDAEDAIAFVDDLRNAEIIEPEFEDFDAGYGECDKCGSRDQSVKREALGIKGILLLFGIPLVKPKRKLVCNECGTERLYE